MKELAGLTASPGIALGRAYVFAPPSLDYDRGKGDGLEAEAERLQAAMAGALGELEGIKNLLSRSLGEEYGHIFRAQMTMLEDEDFKGDLLDALEGGATGRVRCAEAAVEETLRNYEELFAGMEDSYNAQRLADLTDICKRIIRNLLGLPEVTLSKLPPESIVVAEELFPSDTAMMDRKNVRGFVTEKGGLTSHVAILAKSLFLPAAVGTAGILEAAAEGEALALDLLDPLDPERGRVYLDPDAATRERIMARLAAYEKKQAAFLRQKDLEPVTLDGKRVTLSANVGSLKDIEEARGLGAKSVGLFRTEFLFLKGGGAKLPTEEEQFRVYAEAVKKLDGGMLVIRTLDIGGDKEVKALSLPREENPFLGLRGIRLCLKHEGLFLTQLRALLRAAVFGDLRIMFPMVSSVEEFRAARDLVRRAAGELEDAGVPCRPDPPLGVMVETPAAVFLADELCREGSFISLGTNDLTQYVLSVDRGNAQVSACYRTFSPALLRAVGMAARGAEKNGRWAGVCGELGGNPQAIPLLLGLGVEEFSMAAQFLPQSVALIRGLKYEDCRRLAEQTCAFATEGEVKAFLQGVLHERTYADRQE